MWRARTGQELENRYLGTITCLLCIRHLFSKPDASEYYTICQGGAKKNDMMLECEFKANVVLNVKPYGVTGEFKASQITWSNWLQNALQLRRGSSTNLVDLMNTWNV